ncbi:hypothetical protein ACJX0J_018267, partial [Zea mays]
MNVDVYVLIYLDESTICFEPYLSDLKVVIILLDCTSCTAAALTPCACKNTGWICWSKNITLESTMHSEEKGLFMSNNTTRLVIKYIYLNFTIHPRAEIGTAAALTPCAC